MPRRPPIELVFWTASLGQMAVARAAGGIGWSEQWGLQTGILLWEDLESAADWQISRAGRPVVVLELPATTIDTALLETCQDPDIRRRTSARVWIYPQEIQFDHTRWHTYREEVLEPARTYQIVIPGSAQVAPRDLPTGNITLAT